MDASKFAFTFSAFFQKPCCGERKYPSLGVFVDPIGSCIFKTAVSPIVTIAEASKGNNRILII
jgi:hypothetical protein